MNPGYRQEVLNVVLAQLLRERGVISSPENVLRVSGEEERGMPDVLVHFQGLRTVIEGEVGDDSGAKDRALAAAHRRVRQGIAHIAVALVYPAALRGEEFHNLKIRLAESQLEVAVVTEAGGTGYAACAIDGVESLLRRAFQELQEEDVVARATAILDAAVEGFAGITVDRMGWVARLAERLGMWTRPPDPKVRCDLPLREKEAVCRIAGLVIMNAMIFQQVLSYQDDRVRPVKEMTAQDMPWHPLVEHWEFIIRDINYYPIFHLARLLLSAIGPEKFLDWTIDRMAGHAGSIVTMHAALGHDLMGRVYHKLLADAKYLATYYTSIPAATLLLKLAVPGAGDGRDWQDLDRMREMRVADIACGTGTLLMAAADAITDNYISRCTEREQPVDLLALHQTLAADVIHGYDVLASALHLTASTLALRSPDVVFPRMQLFTLPLGGEQKRLGSIEFLEGDMTQMQTDLFGLRTPVRQLEATGEQEMPTAHLPKLDLCVMNPPFTRSVGGNLLFGSSPAAERAEMQRRLRRMIGKPGVFANITAGLGSVFVAVADRHVKEGGRMALVLPKALLSGVAWEETRKLLRRQYQVEHIVVSHDPLRWNFSESTDLSEVLVVARKTAANGPNGDPEGSVVAVNLWKNPTTTFNALAIARDLSRHSPPDLSSGQGALAVGTIGNKMGEAVSIPWADLRDRYSWLLPCAFAQSDLTRVALRLETGELWLPGYRETYPVPLRPLGEIGSLGPDARDMHDGFELSRAPTAYAAFWGHDSTAVYTLRQPPNAHLSPLPEAKEGRNLRLAVDLWPMAARLLIAERTRLNTQRLAAVYVDEPVLSNVWWPVSLKDKTNVEEVSKALAIWLNSTPGLILLLAHRQETQGAWMKFKKPVLGMMPVLDVVGPAADRLGTLAEAYDRLAGETVGPFPEMECDPVRAEIDREVAQALDLPDFSTLRRMLAREPIVCLSGL